MSTNSIRLHRVLRAAPEKIYRAFLEPEAMAKWLAPDGFTCKVHHMDAKVGGKYIELVPGKRIRYTDKFDDPNLAGEMTATIEFKKVSCGTELTIIQEGIPAAIPTEMCYLGWQESLILLAKLVEPDIK